jgi:hypothetical protein
MAAQERQRESESPSRPATGRNNFRSPYARDRSQIFVVYFSLKPRALRLNACVTANSMVHTDGVVTNAF